MFKFTNWNLLQVLMATAVLFIFTACDDDDEPEPANQFPIAIFTVNPQVASVGDEITFSDQSGDPDGTLTAWAWDFGDGNTATEQNPTHTYAAGGTYTVTLTVTDDDGDTADAIQDITINDFNLIWSYAATANISPSSPAIGDDGSIYFGSQDNSVYALNADGSLKWTFVTDDRVRSTPAIGEDGTVYVGSLDDNLYALDPATGTSKWAFTTGGNIFITSPAIAADGTIYIGSDDNNFYAINPDGTQKWVFTTGAQVRSGAGIDKDGIIYVGSNDAKVYAINPDGTEKWSYETGARVEPYPIIDADGTIYVGSSDGNFYAFNPDGTLKWTFATADANAITGSAAIGLDGNIYFGTKEGANGTGSIIYAVTPTGQEAWNITLDPESDEISSRVLSTPTVGADGTIYIGGFNGIMYALNPDGTTKFTYEVDNDATNKWDQAMWTSGALTDEGILYFGDYTGDFYALQVSNAGLANTAWATQGRNLKRTAR